MCLHSCSWLSGHVQRQQDKEIRCLSKNNARVCAYETRSESRRGSLEPEGQWWEGWRPVNHSDSSKTWVSYSRSAGVTWGYTLEEMPVHHSVYISAHTHSHLGVVQRIQSREETRETQRKPLWTQQGSSTQTVTWDQDQTEEPGAVRQRWSPLRKCSSSKNHMYCVLFVSYSHKSSDH